MDEEEAARPDFQRAAEGLEQGLETCHKIVSDYRSKLLSLEQPIGLDPDTGCSAEGFDSD